MKTGLITICLTWMPTMLAAEQGSSFEGIHEPDWTLNILLYVMLAALFGSILLWRKRVFEEAVASACEGEPVSLRAAYNQFWVWLLSAGMLALGAGLASSIYNIKRLFIS